MGRATPVGVDPPRRAATRRALSSPEEWVNTGLSVECEISCCEFQIKKFDIDRKYKYFRLILLITDTTMHSTVREGTVVRKRAEWMRPVDERIMEMMRDEGNLTPQALEDLGVTAANHAGNRLSELAEYGLVEKISRGLYRLTDDGEAFLDEELDASELKPAEDLD